MRLAALAVVLLCAAVSVGDAGPDAIRAHVRIVRNTEPGQLEVYVAVPPAAANRAFTVAATCRGDQVESSYRQLEGERSKGPFAPVVWRNLPGCTYAIATELLGAGGTRLARDVVYARIICLGCDDEGAP